VATLFADLMSARASPEAVVLALVPALVLEEEAFFALDQVIVPVVAAELEAPVVVLAEPVAKAVVGAVMAKLRQDTKSLTSN